MRSGQRGALVFLLALLAAAPSHGAGVMKSAAQPAAGDPGAAAVTEANLLASERFWPYRVSLTAPWPEGADHPLPAGMTGVLIRVEASGLPRIDFGRGGKHEVPVGRTDLLERANQIRTGRAEKAEPNFVQAIKTRMLDSATDAPRRLLPQVSEERQGFLCVFADPAAPGFAELAQALAPLRERKDLLTILFPQGRHPDASIFEQLRSLKWTVPFLYDFLSEPYTRTLIPDGTPMPYVMLQTSEGRVLVQGAWTPGVASELRAAAEATFAAASGS